MIADLFVWWFGYMLMVFVALEVLFLVWMVASLWRLEWEMLRDLWSPASFRQGGPSRKRPPQSKEASPQ